MPPQLLVGTIKRFKAWIRRIDTVFKFSPAVLNRVQIGWVWGTVAKRNAIPIKPNSIILAMWIEALLCMNLLPGYYIAGRQSSVTFKYEREEYPSWADSLFAVHSVDFCMTIAPDCRPNHDLYFFTFGIRNNMIFSIFRCGGWVAIPVGFFFSLPSSTEHSSLQTILLYDSYPPNLYP